MSALLEILASIPPAEWLAVTLALGYLVLAVRQSPWCWACAVASSAIYLVLFAQTGLVMQAALQVFYIAMAVYGWRAWRHGGAHGQSLAVSTWPVARHLLAIGAIAVLTVASGWLVGRSQAGLVPYLDALVAWCSVLATWLVARKVLENWLYWIAVDAIAAGLYGSQGLHATAGLFVLYVAIAGRGYLAWRSDLARRGATAAATVHA